MKSMVTMLLLCGLRMGAQDMQSCPMHQEHVKAASQRQAEVEKHGDEAMGFPHDQTTHHFRLYADGGAIEVTANDSSDSQNRMAIRSHLKHITVMFAEGNFSIPMLVHDQVPPGVAVMKEKRGAITYTFEELPAGGTVLISTKNPEALKAVQEFLKFQIEDHGTGDSTVVGARSPKPTN